MAIVIRRIFLFLIAGTTGLAQQYIAWTVAGGGRPFTPFAAMNQSIGFPVALAADARGNVYFSSAQSILKIDPAGILTLVAGEGRAGSTQDGIPATAAHIDAVTELAADSAGNLYLADSNRIRKVSASGIITTVAGIGTKGSSGDGGPATSAQFGQISGLAADTAGNFYVADLGNNTVRRVSPNGLISTIAGNGTPGFSGDAGPAVSAQLHTPRGLATDATGNLYIADYGNSRIRKVSTNGIVTTVAGNGATVSTIIGPLGDGGPATAAILFAPWGLTIDAAGDIFIGDQQVNRIRRVSPAGIISTVVNGTGGNLGDGGPAIAAALTSDSHIGADAAGNLYIADPDNHRVRRVSPAGIITTIGGDGTASFSGDGGPAVFAQLYAVTGVTFDSAGNLYIADSGNGRVRKVSIYGTITTIAGNGTIGLSGDGGPALNAQFHFPGSLAVDAAGNVYVADSGNARVRKVSTSGIITTFAGGGTGGDGGAAAGARLLSATALAFDPAGSLYIVDIADSRVRKVSTTGIITTVAGTGVPGYSGDGGPAASAQLLRPLSVAVDNAGNLYISDGDSTSTVGGPFGGVSFVPGQPRIRKVSVNGIITTVAGNGTPGFSGDGGPAASAMLAYPGGLAVDAAGNLYIADTGNLRLRVVSPAGIITTVFGGPGADPAAQAHAVAGVALDPAGNIYIADNDSVLRLQPVGLQLSLNAIANAASELSGPVAPGEIVVLRGAALGPTDLTVSTPDTSGARPAQLAGTRVLFNGVAASVIYAWEPQVAAVVPDGVAGPLQVVVEYEGVRSAPLQVPVASTSPGIFTSDAGGIGQAAALNANGAYNNAGAPASPGTIVSFFATGFAAPGVQATIDGQSAEVVYAGTAFAGVLRIDARIPPAARTGNVSVSFSTGAAQTQTGVTVAVYRDGNGASRTSNPSTRATDAGIAP